MRITGDLSPGAFLLHESIKIIGDTRGFVILSAVRVPVVGRDERKSKDPEDVSLAI